MVASCDHLPVGKKEHIEKGGKHLMKEFNLYLEAAKKPKAKHMKDTHLEVLHYGFKDCYKQNNYQDIVIV